MWPLTTRVTQSFTTCLIFARNGRVLYNVRALSSYLKRSLNLNNSNLMSKKCFSLISNLKSCSLHWCKQKKMFQPPKVESAHPSTQTWWRSVHLAYFLGNGSLGIENSHRNIIFRWTHPVGPFSWHISTSSTPLPQLNTNEYILRLYNAEH